VKADFALLPLSYPFVHLDDKPLFLWYILLKMRLLPRWMTNKYLLASTFFVVWLLFFDHNDLLLQFKRGQQLKEVKAKSEFYRQKIAETKKEVQSLRDNAASLEKVAREKYLMKKDNEDLFIIAEK
jgi:cell division protein DivIC